MSVGVDGSDVHVGEVLDSLAEVRNHTEHADGAGEGGIVGVDLLAAVGNPVSAGCGVVAVGCHYRLLLAEEVELVLDLLGCKHASTWGVHAEHYGLDEVVLPDVSDDLCEVVACHLVLLEAVHDVAVGIDDGDLVLEDGWLRGVGCDVVLYIYHSCIVEILDSAVGCELVVELSLGDEFVHETALEEVLWQIEHQIVNQAVEVVCAHIA